MAQDNIPKAVDDGELAETLEAESHERLVMLVLRRTKLSDDEAALLGKVFPVIMAAHHDYVWNLLRRRGLEHHDAEDLRQEVFITLYTYILENGFPDSIPGILYPFIKTKYFNHVRAKERSPFSLGLPSSGSEKPRSEPDINRALDLREVARRFFFQLSAEHQEVLNTVVVNGLSHSEAAEVLGLPEGTVKTRVMAAKRALYKLVKPFLPPSQRAFP